MRSIIIYTTLLLLLAGGVLSCKKDQVPEPVTIELTKWEKIAGDYKVYDTAGVFLYQMVISHLQGLDEYQKVVDSLHFDNFDGQFDISNKQQSNISNWPETHIEIGSHNPILDTANNRWNLISGNLDITVNNFVNDTIVLKFSKTNIQYYIEDLTPYSLWNGKQIAVRQH